MRKQFFAASIAALSIIAVPAVSATIAWAPSALADTGPSIPLNKVVGTKAVDQNNDTVGDVVGAVVGQDGSIKSLIVDVGSWISGKKDIEVPYSGVTENNDGNFVVPITKDQAKSMQAYSYSEPGLRGKLLGENGSAYQPSGDTTNTAMTNNTATTNNTAMTGAASQDSVVNADGSMNSTEVVGLSVQNNNGDSIGKIDQLLISRSGQISGVVVDVGGFLGIGAHPVKLAWNKVRFTQRNGSTVAMVNASKNTLKAMPEYKSAS